MEATESIWYKNLDWSMIWVCLAAIIVHILYLEINGKAVKYTWKNYLFYALSSLLVLAFISEVANWAITNYTSLSIDIQSGVSHFLAALSGLGGGYITTGLIKRFKNKEDA